jgi:hypothetical protein
MNFVDIILIIIMILILIGAIASLCYMIYDEEIGFGITLFLLIISLEFLPLLGFIKMDRGSGSTIGIITSVDKNFFGTTALYIKTSETTQEKYCIEFDEELEEKAKELIGQEVKVSYGERVGLYSTGKCSQAPIKSIELVK